MKTAKWRKGKPARTSLMVCTPRSLSNFLNFSTAPQKVPRNISHFCSLRHATVALGRVGGTCLRVNDLSWSFEIIYSMNAEKSYQKSTTTEPFIADENMVQISRFTADMVFLMDESAQNERIGIDDTTGL